MNEPAIVLACSGLRKVYHDAGQDLEVLADISFSVPKGQRVAIVGASGSGKSTLAAPAWRAG